MRKIILLLNILVLSVALQAATQDIVRIDFENGLPAGWTQEYVRLPMDGTTDPATFSWYVESGDDLQHPAGCTSGNHRLAARNARRQEMRFVTRLVSPVMNLLNDFQPQLTFSHAEPQKNGYSDTLKVYYRTSASDYWHLFPSAAYRRNAIWKQETLQLVSANATYQIAFEITENMGYGVLLDDIIIRATPTCQDIKNLQVTDRHAHDALVSWDVTGAYDHFEVLLTSAPVSDFGNIDPAVILQRITDNVFNPEITLTGLQPDVTYYVYVRSSCDGNNSEYTQWVGTSFETLTTATLPYSENFENTVSLSGSKMYGKPAGWTIGSNIDAPVPFVYKGGNRNDRAPYALDSTFYLSFAGARTNENLPVDGGKYVYAATPEILVQSLNGVEIDFWLTAYDRISLGNTRYAAELLVGVMTDPTDFSTFRAIDTVRVETSYMFKRVSVSLADYFGTGKFIAFVSNAKEQNAVYIDNIEIHHPVAPTPTHIRCKDVTSQGFTLCADIHDADSWEYCIATSYHRNGNMPQSDILYSQRGITGSSAAVYKTDGLLTGKTLYIYTRSTRFEQHSAWSFPVTLRVPAAMPAVTDAAPYKESFEPSSGEILLSGLAKELRLSGQPRGAASVFYPLTNITPTLNAYPRISSAAPNAVGSHLQLCGTDTWFVLPETTTDLQQLKMVFSHATSTQTSVGKLQVGVMTDPYDLTTFTPLASFNADAPAYSRCLVSFDSYEGNGKFIAFRSMDAGANDVSINLIDEIVVSRLTDCREASNIDINVHARSAEVTWNAGGMQAWKVGIAKTRSMMQANYRVVTSPSIRFNDLSPLTTYYITLQTICSTDTMATNDVTYSFTTPQGLPIEEDFLYSAFPDGWKRMYGAANAVFNGAALSERPEAPSKHWRLTNKSEHVLSPMSDYVAYAYITDYDYYYWLISPSWYIDAEEGETVELRFELNVKPGPDDQPGQAGTDDKFCVIVSEDAGKTWRAANATIWSNDGNGQYSLNNDLRWGESQSVAIDFTKYVGKTVQVAFYAESSVSNTSTYLIIDNISIRVQDAQCGGLSSLRAVANADNSATVAWLLNGINPKPAIIQVSTDPEFASLLFNDTIAANTMQVKGLQPASTYYVRGRQACQNDLDWHVITLHTQCAAVNPDTYYETFSDPATEHCWTTGFISQLGAGTAPQRIENKPFGAVLEIAKPSIAANESDGAYAISPEFIVGNDISKYQLVFSAATYSQDADNVHRLSVGVVSDPADPGYTFTPLSEIVLPYSADSAAMRTYVVSLENYIGDIDGNFGHYIMFLSEAGSDSTNYVYIDNVFIEPIRHCLQIFDMDADSAFVDGARLKWTGNASQYELIISPVPVRPDTVTTALVHTTIGTNTYTVTGLQPSTLYYAYVRGLCGDGEVSRWSSATTFTTTLGVPYMEPFAANSLSAGIWNTCSAVWKKDSITLAEMNTSEGWSLENWVKDGITGIDTYHARFTWLNPSNVWLISPSIDMSKTEPGVVTLSANIALCANQYSSTAQTPQQATNDRLGVCISTDNGNTWSKRNAVFWSCDSTGEHYYNRFGLNARKISMDVTQFVGQSVRIAFYLETANTSNQMYIDSVQLSWKEAVCLGVRNLQFVPTSDTTAHASWTTYGTPDEVHIELSDYADFSHIITRLTTAQTSCDFRGLTHGNTYYVRITQEGCTTSVVQSLIMPYVAPFTEAFDGTVLPPYWTPMSGSVSAAFAGTLPTENADYSSEGWKILTKAYGLPANHLAGELSNATSKCVDQWFVSPEIGIPATDTETTLSFDMALTAHNSNAAPGNTDNQEFRVLVSNDNGATWRSDAQWLFADTAAAYRSLSSISTTGERIELDMKRYAGKRVRIALYKSATTADNTSDVHIANLRLAMPCSKPDSLTAQSVDFTSAALVWKGQTNLPTIIEYATAGDFAHSQRDTVNSGLTHTLQGLVRGTAYYVRVWQLCAGNQESDYSNTLLFTTSYGIPYSEPFATLSDWTTCSMPVAYSITDSLPTPVSTTSKWKFTTNTTILNDANIYCTYDSKNTHWLISPQIDLTPNSGAETIILQMDMALTTAPTATRQPSLANREANQFNLLVSTDNGKTWKEENRWIWSKADTADFRYADIPATGQNYALDFTRFAGQKIRIAFVNNAPKSACLGINHLSLSSGSSTCFGVQNIRINTVDTTAHLTLVPADRATKWEVAYGTGTTDLQDMPHIITENVDVTLHNLSLSTTYQVYARSICAEGDTSAWCAPVDLQTPQGVPYTAPFDSTLCNWKRYTGDPASVFAGIKSLLAMEKAGGWRTCDGGKAFGYNHICCTNSVQNAYWLVSPEVNLMPQQGDKPLYFGITLALTDTLSANAPKNTNRNTFYIAVSTDGGKTWSKENVILWDENTATADYLYNAIPNGRGWRYYLDFSKYAGKAIRIALVEGTGGTGAYDFTPTTIHVANAELEEYDTPCFGAADIRFETIGTTATCTIIPNDSAQLWQYAYGESGMDITSAKIYNTPDRTFSLSGLRMSTAYDVYVRSVCGIGDTSVWTGPFSFQTNYGVRYRHPLVWSSDALSPEWSRWQGNAQGKFTRLTLQSGWRTEQKADGVFGTPHTYINLWFGGNSDPTRYLLATPMLDFTPLSSESIEMSFDLALTGSGSSAAPSGDKIINQQFKILVSADGGETWETAATWNETGNADYSYAAIPATGRRYTVDLTQYAHKNVYVGFYAESLNSGSNSDLHIKDLVIDTLSSAGCTPIRSMVLKETTYHTATVEFHSPSIKHALAVEYVCLPDGAHFSDAAALQSDTNVVVITGLEANVNYDVYARMQCADSTWTEWTGPFGFTTMACTAVESITPQEITIHKAVVLLNTPETDDSFRYQAAMVEHNGALNPAEAVTSDTRTVTIVKELNSGALYDVYARKICQPGDTSEWSGPFVIRAAYAVPFFESTHWSDEIDSTWTRYTGKLDKLYLQTSRYSGWQAGKAGWVFPENHAYIRTYTYSALLETPLIDLTNIAPGTPVTLSFDMALTASYGASEGVNPKPTNYQNQSFSVLVSTDGTWSEKKGWTWRDNGGKYKYSDIAVDGDTYELDLSSYAGQAFHIGFYSSLDTTGGGENYLHLQNISLDTVAIASCRGLKEVRVGNVSSYSAQISYRNKSNNDPLTAWIEVSADPYFEDVILSDTIRNTDTYTINHLAPTTTYYLRLRQICSDGGVSAWTIPVSFTTAYNLRYQEDFESEKRFSSDWAIYKSLAANVFNGEALNPIGFNGTWTRDTASRICFNDAHLSIRMGMSDYGWAVSPGIDLTQENGNVLLSFDAAAVAGSYKEPIPEPADLDSMQYFMVAVSDDDGATWQRDNVTIWSNDPNIVADYPLSTLQMQPRRFLIDLSRYKGSVVRVAFYAEKMKGSNHNYYMVDNVEINRTTLRTYTDTICAGDDYGNHGIEYAAEQLTVGKNQYRIISDDMSEITDLTIVVNPVYTTRYAGTVCEGERFSGYGFDVVGQTSTTYRRFVANGDKCDSIHLLELEVIPTQHVEVFDSICAGGQFILNGQTYRYNSIAYDTLSSQVSGCDSITMHYIIFTEEKTLHTDITRAICQGEWYSDGWFTQNKAGYYRKTDTSTQGCDSTVTLHLFVADESGYIYDSVYMNQLPYIYDGEVLIEEGTADGYYEFPIESAAGICTITLRVRVMLPTGIEQASAGGITIAPNPVRVGEPIHILTNTNLSDEFEATMYNATGQLVYRISEQATTLPALPTASIYTLRIRTRQGLFQTKLLVQ